jgi:hypothetical protein
MLFTEAVAVYYESDKYTVRAGCRVSVKFK